MVECARIVTEGVHMKKRMCIIGFGRMGKRCLRLFRDGFDIEVISRRDIENELREMGASQSRDAKESLSAADAVFLAVPVEAINLWVEQINQYAREDCLIIDCCTARLAAEKELSKIRRKRFGLPELGVGVTPVLGKPDELISEYLDGKGVRLQPASPEDYDRESTAAGIAHFIGMALDLHLGERERAELENSPAGFYLLQLIEHLKSNSPSTYKEI